MAEARSAMRRATPLGSLAPRPARHMNARSRERQRDGSWRAVEVASVRAAIHPDRGRPIHPSPSRSAGAARSSGDAVAG